MKVFSLTPARGGSKRIPNKAVVDLCGRPLIEWTLRDSIQSNRIDKSYVSTDSQLIKDEIRQLPVEVVDRPSEFAGDKSSSESVVKHWLSTLDEKPDIIVMLQCTGPFRQRETLDNAIQKLIDEKADSLFFGSDLGRWIWSTSNVPLNYDYRNRIMTQDKEWELVEGSDYIFTRKLFEETGFRLGGKIVHYKIEKLESIDIDDKDDLIIARGVAQTKGYMYD